MNPRFGEAAFAGGFIVLGVLVVLTSGSIPQPGSVDGIGPRVFPYLVGAVLVGSGGVVLRSVAAGATAVLDADEDVDTTKSVDAMVVAALTALLLAFAVLIGPTGWPVAATVLFVGTAWVLGAPRGWKSVAVGFALAMTVQIIFGAVLGLSIPAGPLLEWTGLG